MNEIIDLDIPELVLTLKVQFELSCHLMFCYTFE